MPNWTKDMDETLIQMRNDGSSAAKIGERLGCTRSAVLGRAGRLRLPKFRSGYHQRIYVSQDAPPRPLRIRVRPPKPVPSVPDAPSAPVALLDLRRHHCRYPMWPSQKRNEPMPKPMLFCGAIARSDGPYCTKHADICYTVHVRS